ncbi:hypothetical protein H0H92_013993 [Tricholoma furcatifolium]|nr:hypothetical protein H0H92_013993 [Tricholoma furcatifolium]
MTSPSFPIPSQNPDANFDASNDHIGNEIEVNVYDKTLLLPAGNESSTQPFHSLPKGAMFVPPLTPTFVDRTVDPTYSPPSTSSQRLLEPEPPRVQFASYPNLAEEKSLRSAEPSLKDEGWVPWPLRLYFWIPLVIVLVVGAIGLEVALHFSNKNQGWSTTGDIGSETGILHYVYTLPPVAVAAIPLSAALLAVKNTWLAMPDVTLNNLGAIGLNQDPDFQDLTSFVTAAGFSSAAVLYSLSDPPFIHNQYTIAPFQLPTDIASNGTVIANTTAVKSDSGCLSANVNMTQLTDGSGMENTTENLFGIDLPVCNPVATPQFSPVVFWFFTYNPTPSASATLCSPSISLWDVNVSVDLATMNLTEVTELGPFSSSSNFSSLSGNVTGAPLFGNAYNGIAFNLTNPDDFVLARENATKLQLPAAVFQAAVQSSAGLAGSFEENSFVELSSQVYVAPLTMQLETFQNRVWLSSIAVHLLATAMLLLALCACIVHMLHRIDRRRLRLRHEPGTIASAVSIGAQTGMGDLLAGRQDERAIHEALSNRKFRIDPRTMKIIMEGEEGYEFAASPMEKRKSVFAALQTQTGLSRRFSAWSNKPSSLPTSPLATGDHV